MMVLGNTMAVYAEDSQMVISEQIITSSEMEKLVEMVLDIKNANPGKSEQEISGIISITLENDRKEARGITDIWNALTETEKKLLIRYSLAALKVNDARTQLQDRPKESLGTMDQEIAAMHLGMASGMQK